MTAKPRLRAGREQPLPAPGTVDVRLQGRPEDIEKLVPLLLALGIPVRHSPAHPYPDRNGITVRRYLTADLRTPDT